MNVTSIVAFNSGENIIARPELAINIEVYLKMRVDSRHLGFGNRCLLDFVTDS